MAFHLDSNVDLTSFTILYNNVFGGASATIVDPVEHVLDTMKCFDSFRSMIAKRNVKSRKAILDSMMACIELLDIKILSLPANVENDLKQFTLRLQTIRTLIARKDGVYKLNDLIADLSDKSNGKLLFIEQRIKNNIRMFKDGTGLPPINDDDRAKMQKHYVKQNKLPERIATPFTVLESGVVPLFEDFNILTDKSLKLIGIPYERIADSFVVLKDQKLIAADVPKLEEMFGEGRKKKVNVHTLMNEVLDMVNKTSPIKYALMSDQIVRNPNNANIALGWIIPKDKLLAMSRVGRTVRLQSWSLPHRHTSVL